MDDRIALPEERVGFRGAVALVCSSCGELIEINWGTNKTGFAICDCGVRHAWKNTFEKFTRV